MYTEVETVGSGVCDGDKIYSSATSYIAPSGTPGGRGRPTSNPKTS